MSPPLLRRRRSRPFVALAVLGATLLLSACGSSMPRAINAVSGVPAASISVALSQVGCTNADVCVAAGTSLSGVGPLDTAQFATPRGHWFTLATPNALAPTLAATACDATACLLGGADGRTDLLWRFDATTHQLSAAPAPPGGLGVRALSCDVAGNCGLVDVGANGVARFSFSTDAGTTWSAPLAMAWAQGQSITSLACDALFNCLVSTTSAGHASLASTHDGGATWRTLEVPSSWQSLQLTTCHRRRCVALVNAGSSRLVRSESFGASWTGGAALKGMDAVACSSAQHCVAVGTTNSNSPLLERVSGANVTTVSLRYVPTGLLGVACGHKRCAAVGATTLVSLPSS